MADPLVQAGFRGQSLAMARAIMSAESGGRRLAHNTNAGTGDNSYGLFQINMLGNLGPARRQQYHLASNDQLFNPLTNAKVAYNMSKGGTDWSPWSTYKSGAYKNYLGKGMSKNFVAGATDFPNASGSSGGDNQGLVNYLLKASQSLSNGQEMPSLTDVMAHGFEGNMGISPAGSLPGAIGKAKRGALAELMHEGTGGPTHSTGDHIHAAFNDPQAMLAAIRQAQAMGLSVRENPYTETVDPVHAKNSYHYRTFGGLYNGRKLGEAVDVSGPKSMDFYNWVNSRYGR